MTLSISMPRRGVFDRLAAKRAGLRDRLADDRGIGDPLLAIGTLLLTIILFLSGSATLTNFQQAAYDTNAMNDLNNAATAEAAIQTTGGAYQAYKSAATGSGTAAGPTNIETAAVGFQPASAQRIIVNVGSSGWAAYTVSQGATKKLFARFSNSATLWVYVGPSGTAPVGVAAATSAAALATAANWKPTGPVSADGASAGTGTLTFPSGVAALTTADGTALIGAAFAA